VLRNLDSFFVLELLTNPFVLVGITLLSVYMLNAEIPLFSLKIKQMSVKKNALQILFLLSSVVLIASFQYAGIPLVIVFYVQLSLINNIQTNKN
jgi:CDP-diacylglycerol--serine O-phosphatidyltransferase